MNDGPGITFLSILGPPGAGKTSIVLQLANQLNGRILRLGNLVRGYESEHEDFSPARDALGWLDEASVRTVIDAALGSLKSPTPEKLVIFDNFPGTLAQIEYLESKAKRSGYRLLLVELEAPDPVVRERVSNRRVCFRCEPNNFGDPHAPQESLPESLEVCATCLGPLSRRPNDLAEIFELRLRRYRKNIGPIRSHLEKADTASRTVSAIGAATACLGEVKSICDEFLSGSTYDAEIESGLKGRNLPLYRPSLVAGPGVVPDAYGHARLPSNATAADPRHIDKIPYGRFRNVYLYVTEGCQLRCEHCYMGERLERGLKMPFAAICDTLVTWRQMGGSKVTILGGEPTLHPDYVETIRFANSVGYEHVITTTNGLEPAARRFRKMNPSDFAYVQISLDGGTADTHDLVRGRGTFHTAVSTMEEIAARGFDVRIICTVNRANVDDCFELMEIADRLGVSLVKYHVFSVIGRGHGAKEWGIEPLEWIGFYEKLEKVAPKFKTRVWYQPTYARVERMSEYANAGYRGCIGRTLDRISIFPDGRAYVCSYLFDTDLHYASMVDGQIVLNKGPNEFDLFTGVLSKPSCGTCKAAQTCMGGCPAEELVMGQASCEAHEQIVPVCRLWKAEFGRP